MTWSPPEYADPSRFDEQDVTLDVDDRPTQGTLTLPHKSGRVGAVLLTGGGPFDRDETSGPNKPMKDLAWGLASRGIAVLRYDKPSFTYPELFTQPGFTMTQEYLPHAVAAVRVLSEYVDQVFVVGHSMGGKVAPKVAAAAPEVAGVIIMAGDTQPMHHAAVRVMKHLATIDPAMVPAELVEQFERQAAVVDSPDLSPETTDLPFGAPGSYWLDLRAYDAVATAAKLDVPILILQGGRDYQVTVADDLPGWQRGLADHPATTIQILADDNHQFIAGTGASTPADYQREGHVDPAALDTILDWLPAATS